METVGLRRGQARELFEHCLELLVLFRCVRKSPRSLRQGEVWSETVAVELTWAAVGGQDPRGMEYWWAPLQSLWVPSICSVSMFIFSFFLLIPKEKLSWPFCAAHPQLAPESWDLDPSSPVISGQTPFLCVNKGCQRGGRTLPFLPSGPLPLHQTHCGLCLPAVFIYFLVTLRCLLNEALGHHPSQETATLRSPLKIKIQGRSFFLLKNWTQVLILCSIRCTAKWFKYIYAYINKCTYCCCCSVAQLCLTLCDPMDCSMPSLSVPHHLLEFAQVHVHFIGEAVESSHLLTSLLFLTSIFPSIGYFSNESAVRIRWPKYWSFSLSISPSREYSGLISLKINWFDPLAVQGTLKGLLQQHDLKASILWCSAFFVSSSYNRAWPLGRP